MNTILIISTQGPFGSNASYEALRLGAGYRGIGEEIECAVLLTGNAVLMVLNSLQASKIGINDLSQGIEMADLTDLPLYISKEDLYLRGFDSSDLIDYEEIHLISEQEMIELMQDYKTIFYM